LLRRPPVVAENEDAQPVALSVDGNTEFFFRTPENALADPTPIGTGASFLANLVRGFKVVVDSLANPLVAQSVDIEVAHFGGQISNASPAGFTCTRQLLSGDQIAQELARISEDVQRQGRERRCHRRLRLVVPETLADAGPNASSDLVKAASVNFGGGIAPCRSVTVDVSTTSSSATSVHQVDRTHDVVTVSDEDITDAITLAGTRAGAAGRS